MSRGNGPDHDPGGGRSSESVCYRGKETPTVFDGISAKSSTSYGVGNGFIKIECIGFRDNEGTFYEVLPAGAIVPLKTKLFNRINYEPNNEGLYLFRLNGNTAKAEYKNNTFTSTENKEKSVLLYLKQNEMVKLDSRSDNDNYFMIENMDTGTPPDEFIIKKGVNVTESGTFVVMENKTYTFQLQGGKGGDSLAYCRYPGVKTEVPAVPGTNGERVQVVVDLKKGDVVTVDIGGNGAPFGYIDNPTDAQLASGTGKNGNPTTLYINGREIAKALGGKGKIATYWVAVGRTLDRNPKPTPEYINNLVAEKETGQRNANGAGGALVTVTDERTTNEPSVDEYATNQRNRNIKPISINPN